MTTDADIERLTTKTRAEAFCALVQAEYHIKLPEDFVRFQFERVQQQACDEMREAVIRELVETGMLVGKYSREDFRRAKKGKREMSRSIKRRLESQIPRTSWQWLEVAAGRIRAGENERECLKDYGYVPDSERTRLLAEFKKLAEKWHQRAREHYNWAGSPHEEDYDKCARELEGKIRDLEKRA